MNYQKRIPSREETSRRADTLDGRDLTVYDEPEPVAEVSESDSLRQAEERIEVLVCRYLQLYCMHGITDKLNAYFGDLLKNVIGGIFIVQTETVFVTYI